MNTSTGHKKWKLGCAHRKTAVSVALRGLAFSLRFSHVSSSISSSITVSAAIAVTVEADFWYTLFRPDQS